MSKLISVIVPVYNTSEFLKDCVNSVLMQTYTNFELLLIDDGSKDNSLEICYEFQRRDNRIKVYSKKNSGVSSTRNFGIKIAKGEYVSFLDSDDIIKNTYLEELHRVIIANEADMAFCGYSLYKNNEYIEKEETLPSTLIVDKKNKDFMRFYSRFISLTNNVMGSACRVLFKREIIKELLFIETLRVSEDLVFVLNAILKCKKIACVNEKLYYYRVNNCSVSKSYKNDFIKNQLQLYSELKLLFSSFNDLIINKCFNVYASSLCYSLFTNEIKFNSKNKKSIINQIRKSELYKYFKLKYCFAFGGFKKVIKYLVIWFMVKFRLV